MFLMTLRPRLFHKTNRNKNFEFYDFLQENKSCKLLDVNTQTLVIRISRK